MKFQFISDFFIAVAYFSIPLKWVLVQFGAFIVLCGSTHLINLWTFNTYSRTIAVVMTIAKVLTAIVSCATALMLVDLFVVVALSHNDFLVVLNHEMRTPMHVVIALSSLLQETKLTPEHCLMVNRIVRKGLHMHLGCEVTVVVSPEYKVVFMDLGMLGTGGYEVARRINGWIPKREATDFSTYWEYRLRQQRITA
ncbi:hypothetical protein NE237_001533 [Protea cynaroides]|uniref:Uncharacterized protein n=1 Tax=Protea cynaroides TaxID=273540 RepID=A0A9Q0KTI1_9MAGN|nr:hypothetical protein NE237_001533 [Protea cynaroides]